MSESDARSIAILGLSGTGKTHFGGQLIGRLRQPSSRLRLEGAPADRKVFDDVLKCLQEGVPARHTPTDQYGEETIGLRRADGQRLELAWPDYGGEQLATLIRDRRVSLAWQRRLSKADSWALLIRSGALTLYESAATRPRALQDVAVAEPVAWDDNARYVEMMQILLHAADFSIASPRVKPRFAIVMTCWDEVSSGRSPAQELTARMPFFHGFVNATWQATQISIWGLSSLGRGLQKNTPDPEYVEHGPEKFGYVVRPDATKSDDLTELVDWLAWPK